MKKKFNFGILAIVSVVFFSACGSDSDLFDPEKAVAKGTSTCYRIRNNRIAV